MQETVNKDRDKYIGGSDIPIIMELSPFKKRYDLLLEKAGYKADDFNGNEYTEYGNKMEPAIRDFINSNGDGSLLLPFAAGFKEGKHIREAEDNELLGIRIHTDGENDNAILEIKTTSKIYEKVDDYKIYLVQLLFYMVTAGKPYGLLAVYERPEDLSLELDPKRLTLYPIRLADYADLVEEISDNIERFLEDLQKVKDNPFITESELLPSDINDITRRILALEESIKGLKETEKEIEREKDRLLTAMESAGVFNFDTPSGYHITRVKKGEDKVTVTEVIDEEALKRDLPELFKPLDAGGYLVKKTSVRKGAKSYIKITAPKKEE